jgi:hypothetical protein
MLVSSLNDGLISLSVRCSTTAKVRSMTDEQLEAMHRVSQIPWKYGAVIGMAAVQMIKPEVERPSVSCAHGAGSLVSDDDHFLRGTDDCAVRARPLLALRSSDGTFQKAVAQRSKIRVCETLFERLALHRANGLGRSLCPRRPKSRTHAACAPRRGCVGAAAGRYRNCRFPTFPNAAVARFRLAA